jgi:hypothetical protein
LHSTDIDAKAYWLEREAKKYLSMKQYREWSYDKRIAEAKKQWALNCRGAYRHLDIVDARPDEFEWGNRECYPRFYIVRIPDSALELMKLRLRGKDINRQIHALKEQYWETSFEQDGLNAKLYHRRLWRLNSGIESLLKENAIVEIPSYYLEQRTSGYENYDSAKAREHNSAGTFTIKSSGGDYTSLTNWESGEQCNLIGLGLSIADCYASMTTDDRVEVCAWTTTSSDYAKITVHEGERHPGYWDSDKARLVPTSDGAVVSLRDSYHRCEWLQLKPCGASGCSAGLWAGEYSCRTSYCLIDGHESTYAEGILNYGLDCIHYRHIIWGCRRFFSGGIRAFVTCTVNNCTFYNNSQGLNDEGGKITVTNTISVSNNYDFNGTFAGGDYNLESDASGAPGTNSIHSANVYDEATAPGSDETCVIFKETAAGSEDFRLAGHEYCDAIDNGTNLGSPYDVDIEGESVTGTWDIGADEYIEDIIKIIDETVGADDSIQKTIAINKLIGETVGASDIVNKRLRLFKAIDEIAGALDTPPKRINISKTQNESTGAVDTQNKVSGISKTINEIGGAVDTVIKRINIYKVVPECAAAVDGTIKKLAIKKVLSEIAGAAEHITKRLSIIKIRDELVGALDAAARALGIVKVHDESASAAENTAKAGGIVKIISEVAAAVDSRIKRLWIVKVLIESAGVNDATIKRLWITKIVDETVAAMDSAVKRLGITKIISEITGAIDTVIKWVRSVAGWRETILLRSPITRTVSLSSAVLIAKSLK